MQQTIQTDQFGQVEYNSATHSYDGQHRVSCFHSKQFSINADEFNEGLEQLHAFLSWLDANQTKMKHRVEYAIEDNDLIWDDTWDSILGDDWAERWDESGDGFLEDYLQFVSVNFYQNHIHLWVNTSGLHSDHLVHAHIKRENEAFDVDYCEL
ncbi:MAG: hypothetical protein KDA69_02650 [Planctomycetaceae bacterium]|nr:hypothetical protein [Planctomycetaceae bacterium]MCB9949447.1 hypothetical protein [Planctomycetaceae bacterium]